MTNTAVLKNNDNVAYPYDTSQSLTNLIQRYERSGRAQNVSFRRLVNWIKVGERATHYLHSYPAKLLPQIAHFFLAAQILSRPNEVVLDPFGGTGTVALEALLAGRRAYFSDVNPLAQLIARVKTRSLDIESAQYAFQRVKQQFLQSKATTTTSPQVVNLTYWYNKKTITALCRLKDAINKEHQSDIRDFLLISFSGTCRKVSRADPRLSVPVRLKTTRATNFDNDQDVWQVFEDYVVNNIKRMQNFVDLLPSQTQAFFVGNDARTLKHPTKTLAEQPKKLRANSVSLIITSPPYAGAQKYIRATSLSLGWLDLAQIDGLKPLENATIGREHFPKASYSECPQSSVVAADRLIKRIHIINPLRSKIIASYLNEMHEAIQEMARVLRPGGHLVLVIGNNEVCGLPFKSSEYLADLCQRSGLNLRLKLIDEIKSRGLMTKRNKTASVITREWVLMFDKPILISKTLVT